MPAHLPPPFSGMGAVSGRLLSPSLSHSLPFKHRHYSVPPISSSMRRFSCMSEAVTPIAPSMCSAPIRRELTWTQRRQSQQELEDSALLFLERRKSSGAHSGQLNKELYRRKGSVISIGSSSNASKVKIQISYAFDKSDFLVQLVEASIESLDECQLWFTLLPSTATTATTTTATTNRDSPTKRKESKKIYYGRFPDIEVCSELGRQLQTEVNTYRFPMAYDELLTHSLLVELVSPGRNGGPCIVKHAQRVLELSTLNPSSDELLLCLDLEPVVKVESYGELQLCIQYLPSAARLNVTIHRASNLKTSRAAEAPPSAFVRACLLQVEDRVVVVKKRKTSVRKASESPEWNEVLTFTADQRLIAKCRLEVCVMDERFGNSRPIGQLIFGPPSYGGTQQQQQLNENRRQSLSNGATKPNTMIASRLWRDAIEGRQCRPVWIGLDSPSVGVVEQVNGK